MIDYSTHTEHFHKADAFTYNYKFIDDAIVEVYNKGYTMRQIADALREPQARVAYRVRLLQNEGIIDHKYDTFRARMTKVYLKYKKEIKELEAQLNIKG
mgnify:CR=1 FL=1|tara:strand:+ start:522 stop:818 length:297 start_codon:yes stop_codon:yes gene_type:complete